MSAAWKEGAAVVLGVWAVLFLIGHTPCTAFGGGRRVQIVSGVLELRGRAFVWAGLALPCTPCRFEPPFAASRAVHVVLLPHRA